MIISYNANMAGPYHIDAGLPCQDSFAVKRGQGSFIVAAVADGLGSELYSDIGSSVAATAAVNYCAENIGTGVSFDEIKNVMSDGMMYAYKAVLARAEEEAHDPDEYDTTLCICVYDGKNLYYAQSGDSGMVALLESGEYRRVTTQQRNKEGCVFPLCWGPEKWEFGYVEEAVSSVMLMTDGVFEQLCPPLMRGKEIDINIPLAKKFMDQFECNEDTVSDLEVAACKYLENYPRELLDDDKSIVVLINTARKPAAMSEEYYAIPDWKALYEEAERKLVAIDVNSVSDTTAEDIINEAFVEEHEKSAIQEGYETETADSACIVKLKHSHQTEDEEKNQPRHQNRTGLSTITYRISSLVFLFVLIFSLFAWFVNGFVEKHISLTAVGVFIACFFANASVLLPSSSISITIAASLVISPLLVAFCAAAGASLGEVTGFYIGKYGRKAIPQHLYEWLCEQVKQHGYLMTFIFSVLPLPIFDVIGIIAGALKMRAFNFLAACFCGKLIKFLTYVWISQAVSLLLK